jgi:L-threonylcarbamoyladenylate synthase
MALHLKITASSDRVALAPAIEALTRGGVIAYPTDTLYGLGADPRDERAVGRIFDIKGRSEQQPLPLIASTIEQALQVGHANEAAARLASRFWPGPVTLILRLRTPLAPGVGAHGTVGVRVPDHPVARALAEGLGFPITSTSANRSGQPPAALASEVIAAIGPYLDAIVDAGPTRGGSPSTIVDVSDNRPRLVREGAVAWDRVLESLE